MAKITNLIGYGIVAATNQVGPHIKHISAVSNLQKQIVSDQIQVRWSSTETSLKNDISATDVRGYKGHDMLAPFTAGWHTTDLEPLVIQKSEGSYVYDVNGKKYLDALAGLWCTSLGGSEPRLVAAATKQLNELPFYHSFWNRSTKPSLDLAKELLDLFTANKMAKAFFTNSGSEANDTQVKLVWYYNNALGRPEKKKFIARTKSYHGSTLISASLSGLPALHQQFDLPAPFVLHTDCPHYWRFHQPGETEEEFSTRLANNLENLILKEGPETIAAFIAEPVMGAGGVIPPPATYFEKVQAVLKKYDILVIADEVICGFGRLGTMFGCDKYNIKPDLVSVAKALSSGYMPIGAVLVSPEVSDVIYSQSNKLGANGRFCGGLDISVMENVHKHGDISLLPDASIGLVVNKIENGNKPSVAAIQGFALGGGLELAMGCSARIATPKCDLGLPELKLGVIPGCGGTQRLPRLVGTSKAVDMLMSSKTITSDEGKELGLIDAIVSSEELLIVARCWALDIVEGRHPNCNSLEKTDKLGPKDESLEILKSARQRYTVPRYRACLDVIEEGIVAGGYAGVLKEDKVFKELVLSNTAKGLLHVFLSELATTKVPSVTDIGLKPRRIEKVAVVGGGLMGSGIATALIISNISVVLKEINHEYLSKALKSVEANLQGFVTRGKLNQDKMKRTLSLLKGTLDYEDLKDVDMVIEAVNENVSLKQSIFEDIEKVCTSECIFASNTSTISLDVIGKRTSSQDRILGIHLFSPAHLMPLVEIVRTENTSPQVIVDVIKFTKILKKVPIVVKNCTGFAVNRSFFPYMQGPDLLANLGVDIFRIDRVITEFGMRLGPFQLQDLTGYGIFLAGVEEFVAAYPDRAFQSPLVQLMVENGREGKKNGKGYYTYNKGSKPEADHSVLQIVEESMRLTNIAPAGKPISVTDEEILEMIFFPVVNEACRVIEEGIVVRASDIDIASVHGFKFPSETQVESRNQATSIGGVMFWADTIGCEYIYSKLKGWYEAYGDFFKPSTFLEQKAAKGLPLGGSC